ncbi:MAG: SDR family NAD(P)-dependent oxidoreductase [Microscillaceae bacterium]|nr:SDR family NAD(P)-dependent oxidoreductase [Microscillaceae bacterium]
MARAKDAFVHQYGPWALIAGGAEGLGLAFAEALAAQGLSVFLIDKQKEALAKSVAMLAEKYPVSVRGLELDLSKHEALSLIEKETQGFEIGTLVYSAAFVPRGDF